ncbi:MAG: BtpA/SgcQ family protein [Rhodothermales bacterium]|nr:BtpA/SgcQ family protein [Rhodothermales bacterium]
MPVAFDKLFGRPKPVIAMIHTGPSPGVPGFVCVESALDRAIAETEVFVSAGVDGIMVENMRDFPCVHERDMGPEVTAFMTTIACAVKRRAGKIPVGIQVLFQANRAALAVAVAAKCDFVRAEGWTYAHVSDKGFADASAGRVVRYRKVIGGSRIPIFADIRKKHAAHALTGDLTIGEIAAGMELHLADAIVVTGSATGVSPNVDSLKEVREATILPLIVGSGITAENVGLFYDHADGFIVGSSLKENGVWHGPVSDERTHELMSAVVQLRAAREMVFQKN